MRIFKNTNSALIHSIFSTFLALAIVSCRQTSHLSVSHSDHLAPHREPASNAHAEGAKSRTVISTARSYMGTRYKMGGCSKKGIDCSGLTYTAFKSVHIDLPRTADAQSEKVKTVPIHDLQPGDLLFFTDKKGHKKITHVGIVTEVHGSKDIKFIHASTKAGVVEENLYSQWYISIFIKGGRIL